MDLLESLKQFKKIQPSADYAEKSRAFILRTQPLTTRARFFNPVQFLIQTFQSGSAIALTAVFLILIAGGVTLLPRLFSLNNLASLNPKEIQAEAQAIDIQIQFATLDYEPSDSQGAETQTPTKALSAMRKISALADQPENLSAVTSSLATSSAQEATIEDALLDLSR